MPLAISFLAILILIACKEENSVLSSKKGQLNATATAINETANAMGELHNNLLAYNKLHQNQISSNDTLLYNGEYLVRFSRVTEFLNNAKEYCVNNNIYSTSLCDSVINGIVQSLDGNGLTTEVSGVKYIRSMIDYLPVWYHNITNNQTFEGKSDLDSLVSLVSKRDIDRVNEYVSVMVNNRQYESQLMQNFLSVYQYSTQYWTGEYTGNSEMLKCTGYTATADALGTIASVAAGGIVIGCTDGIVAPIIGAWGGAWGAFGGSLSSACYDWLSGLTNGGTSSSQQLVISMKLVQPCDKDGNPIGEAHYEKSYNCSGLGRGCTSDKVVTPQDLQSQARQIIDAINNNDYEIFNNYSLINNVLPDFKGSILYDIRNNITKLGYIIKSDTTYQFFFYRSDNSDKIPVYY